MFFVCKENFSRGNRCKLWNPLAYSIFADDLQRRYLSLDFVIIIIIIIWFEEEATSTIFIYHLNKFFFIFKHFMKEKYRGEISWSPCSDLIMLIYFLFEIFFLYAG